MYPEDFFFNARSFSGTPGTSLSRGTVRENPHGTLPALLTKVARCSDERQVAVSKDGATSNDQ
jgi:hypothetical protein